MSHCRFYFALAKNQRHSYNPLIKMKKKLKSAIQSIYFPRPRLKRAFVQQALKGRRIYIADVGSTGGPEKRWEHFLEYCHFYSFDPDPRAVPAIHYSNQIFPIGLWSSKTTRAFFLCKNPPSSGLYRIDRALDVFLNAPCHEITKELTLEVDTLQNSIKDTHPVDFVKLDAEGADLEILKGGAAFLSSSCLGLQIEIAYNSRHEGAPLFPEVDTFLRPFGYQLFDLRNDRWIRKNNYFDLRSRPQIIWGNAVYFLGKDEFVARMQPLNVEQKETLLSKFLLLLIVYRHYDYAVDVLEACKGFLDERAYTSWFQQIRMSSSIGYAYVFRLLTAVCMGAVGFIIFWPIVGLKEKARAFVKARTRQLAEVLLNLSRHGPYFVSVTDEQDL